MDRDVGKRQSSDQGRRDGRPAGDYAPPDISLLRLFVKFLRFGFLAFGGPVAQIAMLRAALVEEERWLSPARFNRLLAVMQALPGPEAHELCVHFGMMARGRPGGVLAGLGFMLPGLVLMLVAAWAYARWIADAPDLLAAMLAVQIVILAIIARAVVRIGQHALEDRWLAAIAIASLGATMLGVPFWIPLLAAGAAYALRRRNVMVVAVVAGALVAAALAAHLGPSAASASAAGASTGSAALPAIAALFIAGLKGGLLTFGGAYTAIPYVHADTVGRGWIDNGTFLDGIAVAGMLPAPLVIFATFAGYAAGGLPGALAITAGMFLPAFAFSLIFYEQLEAIIDNPALHGLLAGVAAAAVGIIAATFVQLGTETLAKVASPLWPAALFAAALAIAWRVKSPWVTPALLLCGAAIGLVLD